MGIWWLSDFHNEEFCNNMLQCFFSYFYRSYAALHRKIVGAEIDYFFGQSVRRMVTLL